MNLSRALVFGYGAIAATAVVVAGCSGGGGTSPAAPAAGGNVAPTPVSTATAASGQQYARAIITFQHGSPAPAYRRYYVSPASQAALVQVISVNGGTPPPWVPASPTPIALVTPGATASPNCSVSGQIETCTISIPAPPGNVKYAIQTMAQLTPPPAPMTVLDYNSEGVQITEGTNNAVSFPLHGVVHGAAVLVQGTLTANQMVTGVPVKVTAFDAAGQTITGTQPYDSPFTLTDGDPSGNFGTTLAVNGGTYSKKVTVTSPSDVVTLDYGGLAIGLENITAAGTGKAGGWSSVSPAIEPTLLPIVIPNAYVDAGNPNDPNFGYNTLNVGLGQTISETVSEAGRTNAPYSACPPVKPKDTCIGLADIAPPINNVNPCHQGPKPVASFNPGVPGNNKSYTYTIKGTNPGLCLQQFFDGLYPQHIVPSGNPLQDGVIFVSVTPTPVAARVAAPGGAGR